MKCVRIQNVSKGTVGRIRKKRNPKIGKKKDNKNNMINGIYYGSELKTWKWRENHTQDEVNWKVKVLFIF